MIYNNHGDGFPLKHIVFDVVLITLDLFVHDSGDASRTFRSNTLQMTFITQKCRLDQWCLACKKPYM
jgi:hypothetical protein